MTNITERIQRLLLSGHEIKEMTDWPDRMIEDYLGLMEDMSRLQIDAGSGEFDQTEIDLRLKKLENQMQALLDAIAELGRRIEQVIDDAEGEGGAASTPMFGNGRFATKDELEQVKLTLIRLGINKATKPSYIEGLVQKYVTPIKQWVLGVVGRRIRWAGTWRDATSYMKNDMAVDGVWVGIANTKTGDRLAPQADGLPVTALPDPMAFTTASDFAVIQSGHRYQFSRGGWVKRIKARVPSLSADTSYRFLIINNTDPASPIVTIVTEPVLSVDGWSTISGGSGVATIQTDLVVLVESTNSGSSTPLIGGWTYEGEQNTVGPTLKGWNRRTQNDTIRFDKTDLNDAARDTELLNVIPNTTISCVQGDTPSNYWKYNVNAAPVDGGTYVSYSVNLTDTGGSGVGVGEVSNIDMQIPIAQSTDFFYSVDYWVANQPSFAVVTGLLEYDGVVPTVAWDIGNAAYGIDIEFQPANVSEEWDIVSGSESGSDPAAANKGDSVSAEAIFDELIDTDVIPLGLGIVSQEQVGGDWVCDEDGQYTVTFICSAQRNNNGGEANLWLYATINGAETGSPKLFVIDSNRQRIPYSVTIDHDFEVGDVLRYYVYRASNGANDGGLYVGVNTDGLSSDPAASIIIKQNIIT